MLGTSFALPEPCITPEPFIADLSTYPNAWIKIVEPVGLTFVYPPPTATYTGSPELKADVSTPLINPSNRTIPSASSNSSSPATPAAGILAGLPASAGSTPTILPDVPLPVKYKGVPFNMVVSERFLP